MDSTPQPPTTQAPPDPRDLAAIQSDWQQVGADLRFAMYRMDADVSESPDAFMAEFNRRAELIRQRDASWFDSWTLQSFDYTSWLIGLICGLAIEILFIAVINAM